MADEVKPQDGPLKFTEAQLKAHFHRLLDVMGLDEESCLMRDPRMNAWAARLAWQTFSTPGDIEIDCGSELKAKVLARLVKRHLEQVKEFMR